MAGFARDLTPTMVFLIKKTPVLRNLKDPLFQEGIDKLEEHYTKRIELNGDIFEN